MMSIGISNETAQLRVVVVGIANDFGGAPELGECYDPKSKEHVKLGTFPLEKDCVIALDALVATLEKYNVLVYRPKVIKGLNQIFSRDIAFVIDDRLVIPNIIKDRKEELSAINHIVENIEDLKKIYMPDDARAEGGDVILCNEYIFVGYSEKEDFDKYTVARTNREGLDFLRKTFPNKRIKGFELNKSDDYARDNVLHLDCCFQPIGNGVAIICKEGFKNMEDYHFLVDYFAKENIIELSQDEMCAMNSNVFSISERIIISDKGFTRLNGALRKRGFIVEEVPYAEIGKMSGLFRCSTMPLRRQ